MGAPPVLVPRGASAQVRGFNGLPFFGMESTSQLSAASLVWLGRWNPINLGSRWNRRAPGGSTSYDSQLLLDTTTAPFQHRGRLSWLYDQCFFPSVFGIIPPSASSIIDGVNDQSPGRVMAQDPLVPFFRPHHSTMLFFLAPNIPNFHQACIDIPIPTTSVSFHPSSINQHLYGGHRNNKKGSSQQVCYHHGKTEDEGLCVLMDLPRTHWKGITEQRSQGTVS